MQHIILVYYINIYIVHILKLLISQIHTLELHLFTFSCHIVTLFKIMLSSINKTLYYVDCIAMQADWVQILSAYLNKLFCNFLESYAYKCNVNHYFSGYHNIAVRYVLQLSQFKLFLILYDYDLLLLSFFFLTSSYISQRAYNTN